jgi:hypothetical protein
MRLTILLTAAIIGHAATTAPVSAQQPAASPLDAGFEKWDKNKDGFLDADELAKAFRGPNAKAATHKPGDNPKLDTQHPDHAFLDTWDADKDGKISRTEFDKYEAKVLANLRAAANRKVNYTRAGRSNYRSPYSHRGSAGRGYGTNPYTTLLRSQQRAYQQLRAAYSNQMRYGSYSPNFRNGYRGSMTHRRGNRR